MQRSAIRVGVGVGLLVVGWSCGKPQPLPVDESSTTASGTEVGPGPSTVAMTTVPSPTGPASSAADEGSSSSDRTSTSTSTDGADSTTTGEPACAKNVVLMGYWPPTNEMLRPWSQDPVQNPGGWQGANWEGHGFDVYSFFPEFPPDGDPTNDSIGDDGAVGSPEYELRVDYQATSEDFWRIVDELQPVLLITTSRGGGIGWEIEAIEGGHGQGNAGDPSLDWSSDQHGAVTRPTQQTIEPRSWDAITMYRQGTTLPSQLPMDAIFDATFALGLTTVEIDQDGTSGNFLSGFLGLHGVYYEQLAEHNVAAGHIHVGLGLPVEAASTLIEETLRVVLEEHPAEGVECPGGP